MSTIKVNFKSYSTKWHITKTLQRLSSHAVLSFDTETVGVYSKAERKQAETYLKNEDLPVDSKSLALQVAANNGLSFPSMVNTTHWIFGLDETSVIIIITNTSELELFVAKWVVNYKGKLLIHNTLFDLKILYHRTNKFPKDYEDTQLLAKSLINNVDVWKSKTGLKDLMGSYYPPSWSLYNEYEPDNLKDLKFLEYCAYDGSATYKLWNDLLEYIKDKAK